MPIGSFLQIATDPAATSSLLSALNRLKGVAWAYTPDAKILAYVRADTQSALDAIIFQLRYMQGVEQFHSQNVVEQVIWRQRVPSIRVRVDQEDVLVSGLAKLLSFLQHASLRAKDQAVTMWKSRFGEEKTKIAEAIDIEFGITSVETRRSVELGLVVVLIAVKEVLQHVPAIMIAHWAVDLSKGVFSLFRKPPPDIDPPT